MRSTQTCPKCSRRRFAVKFFQIPNHEGSSNIEPFPAITVGTTDGHRIVEVIGSFVTWICLNCGYTEFYACHLVGGTNGVEALAQKYPKQLQIIDAEPRHQGPFR